MNALEALQGRASMAALDEPAPTGEALQAMLRAATRAPDHGRMRPWRFFLVRGEARTRLGEVFAASLARRVPDAGPELLERERAKPLRAPLIVVVAAHPRPRKGVPEIEQVLSAAAAAQSLLLAAHATGYGGIWRTGEPAYDDAVKAAFGLAPSDAIVGFLYLGTPREAPQPHTADPDAFTSEWHGPEPDGRSDHV